MKFLLVLSHLMSKDCILSNESLLRAKYAIDLFKTKNYDHVITSGWSYRSDCEIAISDVVRDFILDNSDIINEQITSLDKSRETVGDAYYCREYLSRFEVDELCVVTSDYHISRSKIIFDAVFDNKIEVNVCGVTTEFHDDFLKKKNELNSLKAFYSTFKDINFSDMAKIHEALSNRHPYYNGDVYSKI